MDEYKELKCIKELDKDYFDKFCEIVKYYRNELSRRIVIDNNVYTLHDFDHHCYDIYKIISEYILDSNIAYSSEYKLTQRELYILDLAVLFHDIGLSSLASDRGIHSKLSAEFVQNEYDNKSSVFSLQSDLNKNELKALKNIIIAHSNIKDGSVKENENGLMSPSLENVNGRTGTIRSRFLAGVLRLADELDVTVERLGSGKTKQDLKKIIQNSTDNVSDKRRETIDCMKESIVHWNKLELISHFDKENGIIYLYTDDEHIEHCLDSSQTEETISDVLIDIYTKIAKELKYVNENSIGIESLKKIAWIEDIKIKTSNSRIQRIIDDRIGIRHLKEKGEEKREEKNKETKNERVPRVVDTELASQLYEEITNRKLIKYGHFIFNDEYCARDWIDTRELVETKKILNKMVEAIVKDILRNDHARSTIVGVDLVGTLLASRIAFSLQCPLTYTVPEKERSNNAKQEVEINLEDAERIILVTDAIVSFNTIKKLIKDNKIEDKLETIYAILYRPSTEYKSDSLVEKTQSVSNMFGIELFPKSECKHVKCIALNRKTI